jgi:hypothetical protein
MQSNLQEVLPILGYLSRIDTYVPIEQGEPVNDYGGPRSWTRRPMRLPNRFAGLTTEMAIDDVSAHEPRTVPRTVFERYTGEMRLVGVYGVGDQK